MASAQASNHIQSRQKVETISSGDASTAKIVKAYSLTDPYFKNLLAQITAIALTGVGATVFKICVATASAGTNETIVKQHAIGSAPDAVNDSLILECTAEEIAQLGADAGLKFTHIYVKLTAANAADRIAVTHVFTNPRFPADGLSADIVS